MPVHEKLSMLREILDSKFCLSGKRTMMEKRGDLVFQNHEGHKVSVDSFSSGEKHIVALFTLLLFSTKKNSLVLIDEPEISLHAAWQHDFLGDIARVAATLNLQVVLATHSTSIINGRWDLTEELKFPRYDGIGPVDDSVDERAQGNGHG